ncbi:TVP38/TMEM64 family protein [Anaerococcus urinomassiliensis]|uniref:TVP38/TMEM64 family protein n=1 Tax=Anaerococcus urinomassiliensis TaxID=1745712 RepID=UPI00093BB75E|nr:TVP38/TMEM64 family protein [Anaerococcus urinomassiliensis]
MKEFIKKNIYNIIAVLVLVILTILGYIGYKRGLFHSIDTFREFILSFGIWANIIFMLVQVTQIVVPIIPGGLTTVFGVVIFGPFWGFIYNYISICAGSMLVFFISRTFGKSIVLNFFGEETFDKYKHKIKDKTYEKFFAWAILLPVAPDDFLCYLTGLSDMSFKKYATIILLCKPPSIFLYSMGWAMGLEWLVSKL